MPVLAMCTDLLCQLGRFVIWSDPCAKFFGAFHPADAADFLAVLIHSKVSFNPLVTVFAVRSRGLRHCSRRPFALRPLVLASTAVTLAVWFLQQVVAGK